MPDWISGILNVVGGIFGWLNKQTDLHNSTEMKKASEAQKDQNIKDKFDEDIRKMDVDATRRDLGL
jgi:hypothetical protein